MNDNAEMLEQEVEELAHEDENGGADPLGELAEGEEPAAEEEQAEGEELEEGEEPEGDEEQDTEESRPTIFISYQRNDNDSHVADRIYEELGQHYEVFLDRKTLLPATDWPVETERWLKKADIIIALISAKSVQSLFVNAELQDAYDRWRTQGKPRVIPVRVDYVGPYGLRLSAYIGHFQSLLWENKNYVWLFEQLRAAISLKPPPPTQRAVIVGTDILPISDSLRGRWAETFVMPRELDSEESLFKEKRLLWVTGEAGVRNYVALSLAARTKETKALYEVTRARKWSEVNNTSVSDSAIVFRDALPSQFDDESGAISMGEWHSLRAIIERNNIIIATSPNEGTERPKQELRRYQFTDYQHLVVGRDSYTRTDKLDIFTRLLDYTFKAGELGEEKYALAAELLKEPDEAALVPGTAPARGHARALERLQRESRGKFRENIARWLPSDIERFVLDLSQVETLSDIIKLLQQNADIENEIRTWFLGLDDSTRCFVLALAMLPELGHEELWGKYKLIVEHLRRFDPGLRLLPFGVCRRRAHPKVSAEGAIYFSDESVSDAVRQEVVRSYREYLLELVPLLKEWSVPPGRNPKTQEQKNQRRLKIEESAEVRASIARIVGVAGRLGLDDLSGILDYWATDSNFQVRRSVAIALGQAAREQAGAVHALGLIEKWCSDINSPAPLRWRGMAAAIATGSVAAAASDPYVTLRLLQCLERFVKSKRNDARFYASIALKQVARHAPLSAAEGIIKRLAGDKRAEVRVNAAAALNEFRPNDGEESATLSEQWALSESENQRWVALCGIVLSRRGQHGGRPDKYERLLELLKHEDAATTLASVLGELVRDDHHGQVAEETYMHLAREADESAWVNLAAGLGRLSDGRLDGKLLPLLRSATPPTPLLDERLVDVRREALKQRLDEPAQLLNTLKAWLKREGARLELFRALALLLDEGPTGCKSQLIAALAEHYSRDQTGVTELLSRLEDLAPAYFEPLARAVRRAAFERLLQDPPAFVVLASEALSDVGAQSAAREALESFALDESPGAREAMLRALAQACAHSPVAAKELLARLKSSGSPELARIAYEFNYRRMEAAITTPADFPSVALELIREDGGEGESLGLLNFLAAPEPTGVRTSLVNTLAEARRLQVAAADELLAHPALTTWVNLVGLPAEVTRASYVQKIFLRKLAAKLFIRK
jgi:hypothetical protein